MALCDEGQSAWHVVMDDAGALLGFQWIGVWPDLPPNACDIGTFVKTGQTGHGIGSHLFEATKQAALDLAMTGSTPISARIIPAG